MGCELHGVLNVHGRNQGDHYVAFQNVWHHLGAALCICVIVSSYMGRNGDIGMNVNAQTRSTHRDRQRHGTAILLLDFPTGVPEAEQMTRLTSSSGDISRYHID